MFSMFCWELCYFYFVMYFLVPVSESSECQRWFFDIFWICSYLFWNVHVEWCLKGFLRHFEVTNTWKTHVFYTHSSHQYYWQHWYIVNTRDNTCWLGLLAFQDTSKLLVFGRGQMSTWFNTRYFSGIDRSHSTCTTVFEFHGFVGMAPLAFQSYKQDFLPKNPWKWTLSLETRWWNINVGCLPRTVWKDPTVSHAAISCQVAPRLQCLHVIFCRWPCC